MALKASASRLYLHVEQFGRVGTPCRPLAPTVTFAPAPETAMAGAPFAVAVAALPPRSDRPSNQSVLTPNWVEILQIVSRSGSFIPRSHEEYVVCFVPSLAANSLCEEAPRNSLKCSHNFFLINSTIWVDNIAPLVLYYASTVLKGIENYNTQPTSRTRPAKENEGNEHLRSCQRKD